MSIREFINAIKTKEILWNLNLRGYYNRTQKQKAWEQIGNQFNLPVEDCKTKWKGLRRTHSRRIKVNGKNLPPGNKQPNAKWKYEKDMKFLVPLITKKRTLFVDDKPCDESSSVSSVETDMDATPLDSIQAKPENQRKSTIKNNPVPHFIEEVKQRPILWNDNDPNFECTQLEDEAWIEIESKMGISAENCKKKWKCLKVYLAQECVKHPNNRSPWTYFKQLDFVRPFLEQEINTENPVVVKQEDFYIPPPSVVSVIIRPDFPQQVIEEVKKHPLLWNQYSKHYKSVYKKLKTWRKVAQSLESSVEEVKKKWKALRDLFARTYNKNPDEKTNTWPHFQQMLFLAPYLKSNKLSYAQYLQLERESDDEDSISCKTFDSDNTENKNKNPNSEEAKQFTNENFIDAMKKQHILWDSTFNNYKNNKLRCVVWKEVADYFGVSVMDCKKKWKGLRDLFARNYLKQVREEDKHWKHYNQMKFLGPHIREKKDETSGIFAENLKIEAKENSESSSEETQNDKNSLTLTESNVSLFIHLIKGHECIWNLNNTNYRNNEVRLEAWEEIAENLGLSKIGECKKKWKGLRDAFCRNYYKSMKEEDKTWKYYSDMKFLVPNLRYKKGFNSLLEDLSEDPEFIPKKEVYQEKEERAEEQNIKEEHIYEDNSLSSVFDELDRHDIVSKPSDKYSVEDFIDVVKQHEILWDTNNENYKNIELRIKEWEVIAVHFCTSVEESKKKWKALRDSFVRNYFKPIKEKYKNWNYYANMKFLGPHVKYKKGNSLVGDSEFNRKYDDSYPSSMEDKSQLYSPHNLKKFTVKEFVNEIKKHTILWDLSDERCKMKKYRLQAWTEIAAHFCVSSLECKRKWATLRSAFIREFAKCPDNDTWENFKELDFLLPYLKANVSTNNELLHASETASSPPLNETTFEPKDAMISFESNEINSDSQYASNMFVSHPDEKWTENFIQTVKKHKILWDTKDSNYKNPLKRQQAWNIIAKQYGLSIDDSKQKWTSLRETYAVYLNSHNEGCAEENIKWKYYNAMTFLRPHLKVKKLESGYEANNESDSCSVKALKLQMNKPVVNEKSTTTVEFIDAVKENQLIWNWTDDDHKDQIKKEEAWGQIANKFNTSVSRCKERWLALQNSYNRVILSHSNDKKYSWKYLEEMDFLRPFIKKQIDSPDFVEVSGCLTFDDIIEDYSFSEQPMVSKEDDHQEDALFEELFECSPPSEFAQKIEQNEIRKHNTRARAAAKRRKYSDTSSDEDKEFYQNLKDKMKKLPSDVKSEAKGHIQAYLKVIASNHS